MRKDLLALFLIKILLFSLCAKEMSLGDIVEDYRKNGIQSTQRIFENLLTHQDYWLSVLEKKDTDFGYYEGVKYIFVSDKASQVLWLYQVDGGLLTQLYRTPSIVGIGDGAKKLEGDKITPIGVYDFVDKLTKLNQYYGPMAFATNYPNIYDRYMNRTGSGIWIHGKPLNGDRKEIHTRGCIAVENDIIEEFDKKIDYSKSILLSYDKDFPKVTKLELARVLSMLFSWRDSWIDSDIKKYLSFYSDNFKRSDGMSYQNFVNYKTRVFQKQEKKTIRFSDINISPYPNEENKKLFRVNFVQEYKAFSGSVQTYASKGVKELFIELKGDTPHIIIEK